MYYIDIFHLHASLHILENQSDYYATSFPLDLFSFKRISLLYNWNNFDTQTVYISEISLGISCESLSVSFQTDADT